MDNNSANNLLSTTYESQQDEPTGSEKRAALQREQLSRRPSYRKILDELANESGNNGSDKPDTKPLIGENHALAISVNSNVHHPIPSSISHQQQILAGPQTSNVGGGLFHAPVIVTSDVMSVLASTLTNSTNSIQSVVALPQGNNSDQLSQSAATIMSFNNSQADLQNLSATQVLSNVIQAPRTALITTPYYNIHRPPSNQVVMAQGIQASNHQSPQQLADEATKKREIRLMKNREAARHCRVKKKEYLKCLEERVQILEGQNKKLIDELKALKEFYIKHKQDYPDANI